MEQQKQRDAKQRIHVGAVYAVVFGWFTYRLSKHIGYEGAVGVAAMVVGITMIILLGELDKEKKKRRLVREARLRQLEMEGRLRGVALYDDEYELLGGEDDLYLEVPSLFRNVICSSVFCWFGPTTIPVTLFSTLLRSFSSV
ncbi:unnamed protein product [Microthlaspi erraticum]|uniref:Uncharacterized protein n=1 Tax=Microthlaspi erraticum TaxID=1685480 RepID=A0A6D2KCE7_9BRAS|nr:unnamed protein product [Microthlaspi erraticum]